MDNEEQILIIKKAIADGIAVAVPIAIQEKVNGKIDAMRSEMTLHNVNHENDMKRILPVLEAFEASERFASSAKKSGKTIAAVAAFITAVGSAYLIIKAIFHF